MLNIEYIFDKDFISKLASAKAKDVIELEWTEGYLSFSCSNNKLDDRDINPDATLVWLSFILENIESMKDEMSDDFWGISYSWQYKNRTFSVMKDNASIFDCQASREDVVKAFRRLASSVISELIKQNASFQKNTSIRELGSNL